jgi:hypothetical protein
MGMMTMAKHHIDLLSSGVTFLRHQDHVLVLANPPAGHIAPSGRNGGVAEGWPGTQVRHRERRTNIIRLR